MQGRSLTILKKLAFWLVTEVMLNLAGLDNLADYSEFVFEQEVLLPHPQAVQVAIAFYLKA